MSFPGVLRFWSWRYRRITRVCLPTVMTYLCLARRVQCKDACVEYAVKQPKMLDSYVEMDEHFSAERWRAHVLALIQGRRAFQLCVRRRCSAADDPASDRRQRRALPRVSNPNTAGIYICVCSSTSFFLGMTCAFVGTLRYYLTAVMQSRR